MDEPKTLTVPDAGRIYFDLGRNAATRPRGEATSQSFASVDCCGCLWWRWKENLRRQEMSGPDLTNWKPKSAPRSGMPVLLWARLKSNPPSGGDFYPIVGFWHASVQRWKVSPEHLNREEELIATHWVALPEPPEAGQEQS